jgi:hypothetical protein
MNRCRIWNFTHMWKHLNDRIMLLRGKFGPMKLVLPRHLLLKCLCQAWRIFLLDFGIAPTVWYFIFFPFISHFWYILLNDDTLSVHAIT